MIFFLGPGLQRGSCRQGGSAPQFYAQSLSHRASRAPGSGHTSLVPTTPASASRFPERRRAEKEKDKIDAKLPGGPKKL